MATARYAMTAGIGEVVRVGHFDGEGHRSERDVLEWTGHFWRTGQTSGKPLAAIDDGLAPDKFFIACSGFTHGPPLRSNRVKPRS